MLCSHVQGREKKTLLRELSSKGLSFRHANRPFLEAPSASVPIGLIAEDSPWLEPAAWNAGKARRRSRE